MLALRGEHFFSLQAVSAVRGLRTGEPRAPGRLRRAHQALLPDGKQKRRRADDI